jgi:putative RNA 2'-phosphotransferase
MQTDKTLSKFLSLVLRHQPQLIELELDENGWTTVDELLEKANKNGKGIQLDFERLKEIVANNDKQRFTFNETFDKIRANQGHSVDIDLALSPETPPEILYHGTTEKYIFPIKKQGLKKQKRQHVHLSIDTETAIKVGTRHGKPIILKIKALDMHQNGNFFYLSKNGVWLTEKVLPEYIDFE